MDEMMNPELASVPAEEDLGMLDALAQFHIQQLEESDEASRSACVEKAEEHLEAMGGVGMADELRVTIERFKHLRGGES